MKIYCLFSDLKPKPVTAWFYTRGARAASFDRAVELDPKVTHSLYTIDVPHTATWQQIDERVSSASWSGAYYAEREQA